MHLCTFCISDKTLLSKLINMIKMINRALNLNKTNLTAWLVGLGPRELFSQRVRGSWFEQITTNHSKRALIIILLPAESSGRKRKSGKNE